LSTSASTILSKSYTSTDVCGVLGRVIESEKLQFINEIRELVVFLASCL
jgi:hypothetical protein